VEYGLLQKAVPNKGGKGDKRIIGQKRSDAVIAFGSIVADICRMECSPCLAGVNCRSSNAMHGVFRLSWVVERVGSWKGWLTTAESKFHLETSSVTAVSTDYSTTFLTRNTMADDGQTSRLDNAGTLQQSVSTSVIHEKVTIVSFKA
jgi:hypothetical protein